MGRTSSLLELSRAACPHRDSLLRGTGHLERASAPDILRILTRKSSTAEWNPLEIAHLGANRNKGRPAESADPPSDQGQGFGSCRSNCGSFGQGLDGSRAWCLRPGAVVKAASFSSELCVTPFFVTARSCLRAVQMLMMYCDQHCFFCNCAIERFLRTWWREPVTLACVVMAGRHRHAHGKNHESSGRRCR